MSLPFEDFFTLENLYLITVSFVVIVVVFIAERIVRKAIGRF